MTKKIDAPAGPYEPDQVACGTCGQNPATHWVYLSVSKGIGYGSSDRRDLFNVSYAVCGPCAREMIEVKLGANLKVRA